jgi:hypothetical protein
MNFDLPFGRQITGVARQWSCWAGLCVALCLVLPVLAHGQTNQAGIVGTVSDSSGGTLPGVTVSASSPTLQVPTVTAVTDERGHYRITSLPPGVYSVTYELAGFQTVKRDELKLPVNFVATLDQVMSLGSLQETVTVSGSSPLVDVTNPATSADLDKEQLDTLPTTRDGLKAFMSVMPGVRPNLEVGASGMTSTVQFRSYGQAGQSWQMLDGVMFSAPNSGGANGSHVDMNVLDSTRIQTVGSSAEMPRRGIMLDAVMKSGGNQFHGELIGYGSSGALESDNTDAELEAQGVAGVPKLHGLWDYSASGGGRIIRDRLWFYAGLRASGFDRDILNAFDTDGVTPLQVNTELNYRSGKLSYQLNDAHRLSGFYHWATEFQRRGGNQFTPKESRNIYEGPVTTIGATWQGVKGSGMVFSLQGGRWFQDAYNWAEPGYDDPTNHKVSTIDTFTQVVSGDALQDGTNLQRWRNHFKGSASLFKTDKAGGSHNFKVGFDYLGSEFNEARSDRPAGNFQLRFNNGVPFQISTFNYPVQPTNIDRYLGFYGQDSWQLSDLTLSLGLRFSSDKLFSPAQCHDATDFSAQGCWDQVNMRTWNSFAPRLHAAYDIGGNGRSVIKGGWGRFSQLRDIDPDLTTANRNGPQTTTWNWRDLNGNRTYDPGEVNTDPNGPDFLSISGVTNAVPNPDENQPKTDEFSLTFERELPGQWGLRVTGVYSRNFDLRRLAEPLRPRSAYSIPVTNQDPGPDGRVGTPDDPGRTITYYEYPTSLRGAAYAGTMYVNTDGQQTFKTFEVAGTRRMADGWHAAASYTLTQLDIPFNDGQADNPNTEIFTANNTLEITAKASVGYDLPWGIKSSGTYEWRSGTPQARNAQFTGGVTIPQIVLNVEDVGSINLPAAKLVSFRMARTFAIKANQNIEARFDFFNVLNTNFVTAWTTRAGSQFLVPTAIIQPRILQVGVTYRF